MLQLFSFFNIDKLHKKIGQDQSLFSRAALPFENSYAFSEPFKRTSNGLYRLDTVELGSSLTKENREEIEQFCNAVVYDYYSQELNSRAEAIAEFEIENISLREKSA